MAAFSASSTSATASVCMLAVRPEGANYQWRKIPPAELSIDSVANERLGWVAGRGRSLVINVALGD